MKLYNHLTVVKQRNGVLTIWVNLHGCNIDCDNCVSKHFYTGKYADTLVIDIGDVVDWINRARTTFMTDETKCVVVIGGGEPLIHPDIVELVSRIPGDVYTTELRSNGVLLTREISRELYDAGLHNFMLTCHNKNGYNAFSVFDDVMPARKVIVNYIIDEKYASQINNIRDDITKYDMNEKYVIRISSFVMRTGDRAFMFSDDAIDFIKHEMKQTGQKKLFFHPYLSSREHDKIIRGSHFRLRYNGDYEQRTHKSEEVTK